MTLDRRTLLQGVLTGTAALAFPQRAHPKTDLAPVYVDFLYAFAET